MIKKAAAETTTTTYACTAVFMFIVSFLHLFLFAMFKFFMFTLHSLLFALIHYSLFLPLSCCIHCLGIVLCVRVLVVVCVLSYTLCVCVHCAVRYDTIRYCNSMSVRVYIIIDIVQDTQSVFFKFLLVCLVFNRLHIAGS